jgi:cell division protease FtsH
VTPTPLHWTARIKQINWIIAYVAFAEYSYPTPFIQSRFGVLCYAIIVFYIVKLFWRLRQERSARFYKKTQRWHDKIMTISPKLSDYTRYRILRIVRYGILLYGVGFLIDGTSDSCAGAIACVGNIPFMLVNNFAELLMFAVRLAMSFMGIFGMMFLMARMDLFTEVLPDAIKTRFDDVYGQDNAVSSMKELIKILNKPDEVESRGGYMPGGILLHGPPGTGKTMLAEAAAGETGVPFLMTGPESFTNMFVGVPVMKVKMLFRRLRKLSLIHGGVVCFMDEIDVLGNRGMGVANQWLAKMVYGQELNNIVIGGGGAAGSGALQMMLTEMSGMSKPKGFYNKVRVFLGFKPIPAPKYRILWIGATNMKDRLDPALLRPGRFDRHVQVSRPNLEGRMATLQGYLNKVEHVLADDEIEKLARTMPSATGASIKDAVNEGLLKTIREGRHYITYPDMVEAMRVKLFGETNGRAETEDDRWRVALHEAAHAVASHHYRPEMPIQFASVEKRGGTGGMVLAQDEVERYTLKSRLIANIKVSLASVWAERTYFKDDLSTGPGSDLEKATETALRMFARHGMGSTVMVFKELSDIPKDLRKECEAWLNDTYDEMDREMRGWRDQVELVAQLLEEHGTIDGDEIHNLIERMT